jgi:uncharacterized protein
VALPHRRFDYARGRHRVVDNTLPMPLTIDDLVRVHALSPHPEGGFFREMFRAPSLSTIYYAMAPSGLAPLHRLRERVELWHHYDGAEVELHTIDDGGAHRVTRLSSAQPLGVVPAGAWQATRVVGAGAAFVGCSVAPAFDFADWEMPPRAELLTRLPALSSLVMELTRA